MPATTTRVPFSRQIRDATVDSHSAAQNSAFMSALFQGELSTARYAAFVAQNRFVYDAIEQAAATMRFDPIASAFADDRLTRLPAVDSDLRFLLGDSWRESLVPTAATARYLAAIQAASSWSGGFVAHHYVRYLGDLSGGQHIAKAIARDLEFADEGIRAFAFDIPDLDGFKASYRQSLDEAAWTPAERTRIVEEILGAYNLATAMLHDL